MQGIVIRRLSSQNPAIDRFSLGGVSGPMKCDRFVQ